MQGVAEGLRVYSVMSVSGRVQAVFDIVEDYLARNNMLVVFVPSGSWKAGSRGGYTHLQCLLASSPGSSAMTFASG